jgi:hypothetical protein
VQGPDLMAHPLHIHTHYYISVWLRPSSILRTTNIFPPPYFFFLVSWGGVRLSPLGTSATKWLIVPAPDARCWMWSSWWNEN